MLKKLAVVTSVAVCSLVPAKALANSSVKFDREIAPSTTLSISDRNFELAIAPQTSFLSDLNHDLYGLTKSISKKLGLDTKSDEIDDGSESLFREYALFFLLFGGLFGWMAFKSLSEVKRR